MRASQDRVAKGAAAKGTKQSVNDLRSAMHHYYQAESSKGGLKKAALIIDVAAPGDAERLFTRVEGELARRYGQPADAFSEGDFTGDVSAKVSNGELIRATEWRGPGAPLRLFIPRRLDGVVRIEIQRDAAFQPITENRIGAGVDQVR